MRTKHFTTSTTAWRILASDMTGYDSLALLLADGKTPYPGLDAGMHPESLIVRTEDGSGADGAAFYVAFNRGADFAALANDGLRDNEGHLISGSGQQFIRGGRGIITFRTLWNVWIRKLTGANEVILSIEV